MTTRAMRVMLGSRRTQAKLTSVVLRSLIIANSSSLTPNASSKRLEPSTVIFHTKEYYHLIPADGISADVESTEYHVLHYINYIT
jgi:hypothetical protein